MTPLRDRFVSMRALHFGHLAGPFLAPSQLGYRLQLRNSWPLRGPCLTVLTTMIDPHLGHLFGDAIAEIEANGRS